MHSKRIHRKVKDVYNAIGAEFSHTRVHAWEDFKFFKEYLSKDSKILDLGCGNGRLIDSLDLESPDQYLGVDQSTELLGQAKKKHPSYHFLEADMSELELMKNREFDVICAIASFHHLAPKTRLKTLKLWREYLAEDGMLLMTNWNLYQKKFWPLWLKSFFFWPLYGFALFVPWKNKEKRYYTILSPSKVKRLLKKSGFKLERQFWSKQGEETNWLNAYNLITIARKI